VSIIDRILPHIARFLLIILFPFSAIDKIFDSAALSQANSSFLTTDLHIPGWLLLLLGGCLEVFGSLGILFNVFRRQFALLYVFYCAATAILFHNFWSYPFLGNDWLNNFWPFLKNFGLVAGFLFVAADAKMQPISGAFSFKPRPEA
jgi:putative oxidoreductase